LFYRFVRSAHLCFALPLLPCVHHPCSGTSTLRQRAPLCFRFSSLSGHRGTRTALFRFLITVISFRPSALASHLPTALRAPSLYNDLHTHLYSSCPYGPRSSVPTDSTAGSISTFASFDRSGTCAADRHSSHTSFTFRQLQTSDIYLHLALYQLRHTYTLNTLAAVRFKPTKPTQMIMRSIDTSNVEKNRLDDSGSNVSDRKVEDPTVTVVDIG